MTYPGRNIVVVPFAVGMQLAIDGQINASFQDETDLGCMRMLRQNCFFLELHEQDLMLFRLGQKSGDPF